MRLGHRKVEKRLATERTHEEFLRLSNYPTAQTHSPAVHPCFGSMTSTIWALPRMQSMRRTSGLTHRRRPSLPGRRTSRVLLLPSLDAPAKLHAGRSACRSVKRVGVGSQQRSTATASLQTHRGTMQPTIIFQNNHAFPRPKQVALGFFHRLMRFLPVCEHRHRSTCSDAVAGRAACPASTRLNPSAVASPCFLSPAFD